jgi:hypothetical protein
MIRGAYNASGGWVFFLPLIGYEQSADNGAFIRVEFWGASATTITRKRNHNLLALR